MTDVKQAARPGSSAKKKTIRKKATGTRKTASRAAIKKTATAKKTTTREAGRKVVTPEERYRLIAEAAFLKAESRGFVGGDPVVDWLAAEQEIDDSLTG